MEITGNREKLIMALLAQPEDKLFDLKDHREKRSLNANAYAWALIGKIANVLRATKEEVYFTMLERYGQSQIISVKSEISIEGFIKYSEPIGTRIENGIGFTDYRVFKGSSEYDTREMAILIDGIISEAEELNIETLPPEEIQRLTEKWGK